MEIKLQKWGNSDAIRIPSNILKTLGLKTNDIITLEQVEDKIIITKTKNKKIKLAEEFKKYNGKNLAKDFVWDESVGNELW